MNIFLYVLVVGIIITIVVLLVRNAFHRKSDAMRKDHFIAIMAQLSFVAVAVISLSTLLISVNQYKLQNDMLVYSYIDKFFNQEMTNCRYQCNDFRSELKDDSVKLALITLFRKEIDDKNMAGEMQAMPYYNEYLATERLLRYFDLLSSFEYSNNTRRTVTYYYKWWRSYSNDIIKLYKAAEQDVKHIDPNAQPLWLDLTDRMDKKLHIKKEL